MAPGDVSSWKSKLMTRLTYFFAALVLLLAAGAPPPAHAATCTDAVNAWVDAKLADRMKMMRKAMPYLKEKSEAEAHALAGKNLIQTTDVELIADGYMLLLFRGDSETLTKAGEAADALRTEKERAPFYLALGLYQLRTLNPEIAAKGRNNLIRARDSRYVRFLKGADWKTLIEECEIAK